MLLREQRGWNPFIPNQPLSPARLSCGTCGTWDLGLGRPSLGFPFCEMGVAVIWEHFHPMPGSRPSLCGYRLEGEEKNWGFKTLTISTYPKRSSEPQGYSPIPLESGQSSTSTPPAQAVICIWE
jgi:hypothetical protein